MKRQLLFLFAACFIAIASYSQAPTITLFSPASGPVGTLVTITGTNLSSPTAFTIGGVSAIAISNTGTTLVGMVMPGAVTGTVSVSTSGGATTSSSSYTVAAAHYPAVQQGPKLVGTGSLGAHVNQGMAVSLSADGNTAIVGAPSDSNTVGAAWIYTRSGGIWSQQGNKLVGTGAVGHASQGSSVSLSADGNTAIVGGAIDNNSTGAAWVYTRTAGIWAQQGNKLVGTGAVGASGQSAVSLSADGNTAILGGADDNNTIGAAWIFTRSGGVWSQQGSKLVGTGAVGNAQQGHSVSLSADGNSAIVGGYGDSSFAGAVWIYTRSGNTWTQQGNKLKDMSAVGTAYQGISVSLSANGNTAVVGGYFDNNGVGAAWIYTRSGNTWTQQGSKLIGSGSSGNAGQGQSVSLSADGNIAIVGGYADNSFVGAVWVYTRSGSLWTQQGNKLTGTGAVGMAEVGFSVSLSADGNTAITGGADDNNNIGAAWVFAGNNSSTCSPDSSVLSHSMCQGDTFAFGGFHLTSSGTYRDTLTNVGGCDSIVILNLTVHSLPVVTWALTDTFWCQDVATPPLTWLLTGASPAGGAFSGANVSADTLYPTAMGYYPVTYTYSDGNHCRNSATNTFDFEICTGINTLTAPRLMKLSPNPNSGSFILETPQQQGTTYTISDMLGQIIQQQTIVSDKQNIDIGNAPAGIYILSISGISGSVKFVVMR